MTATATPVTLTREGFLQALRDSNVLADAQFVKAVGALGDRGRTARSVADRLVKADVLTRFQSERLLTGRSDGFFIGPYLVLDYIGKSTTGRVYKARHTTMNRLVAIKVLATPFTQGEATREAVRTEARAAALLAHPNVVTLLDANQIGGRQYFVREYVNGPTLAHIVAARGPLPVGLACEYLRQAALGLQHAHEKGTAHGKLSPTAILVGEPAKNGNRDKPLVKVSGFGLGTFTAEAEGSTDYAAPEPAGPCATARADLYSLGCILYFLLAGRPPFAAGGDGPRLEYLRPDVPAPLGELVAALLTRDPTYRPGSAEEVGFRLAAIGEAEDRGGMVDYGLNVPRSASDSGAFANPVGPGDSAGHEPLTAIPSATPTGWDAVVNAADTFDGMAVDDPTPAGGLRRRAAPPGNPIALAVVVGGVIAAVLAVLFFVVRTLAK